MTLITPQKRGFDSLTSAELFQGEAGAEEGRASSVHLPFCFLTCKLFSVDCWFNKDFDKVETACICWLDRRALGPGQVWVGVGYL